MQNTFLSVFYEYCNSVELKESEMSKFCHEKSILLLRQKEDVESPIINHGPYCLAPKFSHLEVPQDEWFKKNTNQKQACVKKFRNTKMSNNSDCTGATETASTPPCAEQARIRISVDLVNLGITSLHPTTLQCMSGKVEKLLTSQIRLCRLLVQPVIPPLWSKVTRRWSPTILRSLKAAK